MNQLQLISDQSSWEQVATELAKEPELAVDTESNSLYTYREKICLIQLGTNRETFLLDPLAVQDLSSLGNLNRDAEDISQRKRPSLQPLRDCLTLNQRQYEKFLAFSFLITVDRANVAVIQRG